MGTFKKKIENGKNNLLLNGQGEMQFKNGDIFKGTFKDNYLNGKGTKKFKDGSLEKGIWKNGNLISK